MPLDHDKLKRSKAGSRAGFGWKPKGGDNRVRVLPPGSQFLANWEALENLALPYKIHFLKIEGRPPEVTRCLEELKQRCPACDTWRVHRKSDDPGLKEMARDIAPADQYLFNILDIANLQAGIQPWPANWTCWDKIMEIAANPLWGNVVDPADGVNFIVTMTPAATSRTGYNTYSVLPEPQRTTVMSVLEAIANWQAALDELGSHVTEPKADEEIRSLLEELGFPAIAGGARRPVAPVPVATAQLRTVASSATPLPGVLPAGAPMPIAVGPLPVTGPAAAAVAVVTGPSLLPSGTVHYDPGPQFVSKVSEAERPVGAPRCFGAYDPKVHRCAPCPVISDCQIRMLGIN